MSITTTVAFLLISTLSALVQSTTGFGYGTICMALLPYFMPNHLETVAICSLCTATTSTMAAVKGTRHAKKELVIPLCVGFFIASAASIFFAKKVENEILVKGLGIALVLLSIYFMFYSGKVRIKPTFLNGVIAGALGGIGTGFLGIGSPPAVIYLMSATDDKNVYRSSSLAYFAIGSWYASGVRVVNGITNLRVVTLWLMALAALAIGTYIGGKLFDKINAGMLTKIIYGFMAISGVAMMF